MQMTTDEYADYIADGTRYQRGQHRWQAVRDRAKRVIDEITAENGRLNALVDKACRAGLIGGSPLVVTVPREVALRELADHDEMEGGAK